MGTNYYLLRNVCPHCKRPEEKIHIGKSSAGWFFCFQGYEVGYDKDLQLHTLEDWLPLLNDKNNLIVDEYEDKPISAEDFLGMIKDKQKNYRYELSHNTGDAYYKAKNFDCYDVLYGGFT